MNDVVFFSSSCIDEIWTRSTAMACARMGLKVSANICAEADDPALQDLYGREGIELKYMRSLGAAADVPASMAITASSGLNRKIYPTAAKYLVHMPHSLASLHMIYPDDAFDGYDVLFACGPHHAREFKALSRIRNLPDRSVFEAGYGKLDVFRQVPETVLREGKATRILIAPSWGEQGLLETLGMDLVKYLVTEGYEVCLRPHPLFFLDSNCLYQEFIEYVRAQPRFTMESPFDSDVQIWCADVVISDYSGFSFEYFALRRRPVIFVDVPLKEANSSWRQLGIEPVEIALRERMGIVVKPETSAVAECVEAVKVDACPADAVIGEFLYNPGADCSVHAYAAVNNLLQSC